MLSRLSLALIVGLGALAAVPVSGEAASCAPPLKVGEFTRSEAQSAKVKRCEDDSTTATTTATTTPTTTTPEKFLQISENPHTDADATESCKITTKDSNPNCVALTPQNSGCIIKFNSKTVEFNSDEIDELTAKLTSSGCELNAGGYHDEIHLQSNGAVINGDVYFLGGQTGSRESPWHICFTESSEKLSDCTRHSGGQF